MAVKSNATIRMLVDSITATYREDEEIIKIGAERQISNSVIIEVLADLRSLVFAGFFGKKIRQNDSLEFYAGELLENVADSLQEQIGRALVYKNKEEQRDTTQEAERITYAFLQRLPEVRKLVATDVSAAFDGDPAAFSKDEIILSYPGVHAGMVSRLAHELYLLGVPLIPRMMTEYAHNLTGIDIHPGASIGHHLFIDHGTGIVIGETSIIGNYVKIYQGVTLGALSTRGGQLLRGVKRHPTIEDHVTIYSGASILGGNTVIGEGVVIGSNAFITKSVPEKTRVSVKNPELQFMLHKSTGTSVAAVEFSQQEFWDYEI
jgi:serine O-acetyltransferase